MLGTRITKYYHVIIIKDEKGGTEHNIYMRIPQQTRGKTWSKSRKFLPSKKITKPLSKYKESTITILS